jgi:hypothetical protein
MMFVTFAAFLGIALPNPTVATAAGDGQAAPLQRKDFAQGIELTPTTPDTVQTMLLPESVYQGLSSVNLDDMRVFNAEGKEVPFAIRSLAEMKNVERGSAEVPLFPIHTQSGADQLIGDVSLQLTRSVDGRVLEVVSREGAQDKGQVGDRPIAAYILDLGMLENPAIALTLPLPDAPDSFLARYTIEASDDLTRWREVVPQATFANLDSNGTRLLRRRVVLPPIQSPYLRLRWLDSGPKFEIRSAQVEYESEVGSASRRTIVLQGSARPGGAGAYDFPSAGPIPITSFQLVLPEPNTLIQATVQTAPFADGPWQTRFHERFFRTAEHQATRNDPYPVGPISAQFWGLVVDSSGGGLGIAMPKLELEYYPHQLAFIANGEGPFTLAFGKAGASSNRMAWTDIVRDLLSAEERTELVQDTVLIGPPFTLAGLGALVPLVPEEGPIKYILWAVLLVGVGLLGTISLKLVRKLD